MVTATTVQALTVHAVLAEERARNLGLCGRSPGRAKLGSYGELRPVPDQNGERVLATRLFLRHVQQDR
jgi:hypothetical protein